MTDAQDHDGRQAPTPGEPLPEILFDKTAPRERRLVIVDRWGGQARMSTEAFIRISREGVSERFRVLAEIGNAD